MTEKELAAKATDIRKQAYKAYYEKNKVEILKRRKLKRQKNLKDALQKEREYRQQNPDKIKQHRENYWKRKAMAVQDKT